MSKQNEFIDFIEDMIQAINDINFIISKKTFEEFSNDIAIFRAVERLFEILGEAANRIPKEVQTDFSDIPWTSLIGMRNRIIHAYDRVNPIILWDTIKDDLPGLLKALNELKVELEENG